MKRSFIAIHFGLVLIFGPVVLEIHINRWIYYLMILVGVVLISIAGYNAQARALGQGEPGEELLQKAWHWFRVKVLRQQVDPLNPPETANAHQSLTPKPALSLLSKTVQGIGLVLVITPTILGWQVGNDWRMGFIALGSVFIIVARKTLPPQSPNDPPHGKELLQAAWGWLQQRLKGKL
jgi:hypothetical protein